MRTCTTHHYACDCREKHFAEREAALMMEIAAEKRENAKLREALTKMANHDGDWNRMWAGQVARDALKS